DQRNIAAEELERQRRALARNARSAYQALVAGISEVEARRQALVSAQAAYDASQVGLEVGTRTVLDVLNNQQNLFTAQQAYALARYNYLQSRLLLEQAAGTLDVEDVQEINRLLPADAEAQVDSVIQEPTPLPPSPSGGRREHRRQQHQGLRERTAPGFHQLAPGSGHLRAHGRITQ